jgi:molybdopterin-guanine dinucleotide biosynthesis protein A
MTEPVTGIILAGGQGRRMGTLDKGLQLLHGKPMVEHVIERLQPQVDALIINANQNADAYGELAEHHGARVVPDRLGGFAGPLAGLQAGLFAATTPLVVTVPCDSPFLPRDLVARLRDALQAHGAELAVAKTFDQPHPVFALVRIGVRENLNAILTDGGRKIDAWYAALPVVEVQFDDEAEAFENINTQDELSQFEAKRGDGSG